VLVPEPGVTWPSREHALDEEPLERAGGNPFFVGELGRLLSAGAGWQAAAGLR